MSIRTKLILIVIVISVAAMILVARQDTSKEEDGSFVRESPEVEVKTEDEAENTTANGGIIVGGLLILCMTTVGALFKRSSNRNSTYYYTEDEAVGGFTENGLSPCGHKPYGAISKVAAEHGSGTRIHKEAANKFDELFNYYYFKKGFSHDDASDKADKDVCEEYGV